MFRTSYPSQASAFNCFLIGNGNLKYLFYDLVYYDKYEIKMFGYAVNLYENFRPCNFYLSLTTIGGYISNKVFIKTLFI